MRFDDKEYVNLNEGRYLPWNVLEPYEVCLQSDSRNRKDIQLRIEERIEESQEEKERLENVERENRKLREKLGPKSKSK